MTGPASCLVLSCPSDDLASAAQVITRHGLALLPVGGEGDLARAAGLQLLYIVEIADDGPRSAATWCADLGISVPLNTPDPADVLPPSWMSRHPEAYSRSRGGASATGPSDGPSEAELWDDEDEPPPVQVFVPVTNLRRLPREQWIFTNELVRKQQRGGRRFAPRVPTLVVLPEDSRRHSLMSPLQSMPRITRLFTTPVKGFALHSVDAVDLDSNGAVGDRDFFMVDDDHRLVSITRIGTFASWHADFDSSTEVLTMTTSDDRRLEAPTTLGAAVVGEFFDDRTVPGRVVEGPWSAWLSEAAGRSLTLIRADTSGGAFDERPVTLLADETVSALGEHAPDGTLDARRFRMLIGVEGVVPYAEDTWQGRALRVGEAEFVQVHGPVPRCNATTRNPDSGVRDVQTLRVIEEQRGMQPNEYGEGLNCGVYATVVRPGRISVGDALDFQ